ncbi:MAG TPA: TetR/AcrR family transcriptional regulator [Bacillaceae bacterium]|nr:TetR/AcrR family transcriptional regulator [Paenibacillus bovis]HLU22610.1 TetR/AcrR family transcriptional regulator [Bacillaceae bacterium]
MVKKQLIMEKALELFAKQGFEATSVQQITEHCGISKGAFYLSFKSKDELIMALINQFMMQFTSDIDYVVKNSNTDELLYDFYYTSYSFFLQHSDFAKVFIKEQIQSFNEEFIEKIRYFDRLFDEIIQSMIERLYGEETQEIKYDLGYCIKKFMGMYSELFFYYNVQMDIPLLVQSLVEKTNLIAKHMTIPFISNEFYQAYKKQVNEVEFTKKDILEMIDQKLEEMDMSIEKESLILLKQEVSNPTLASVLVNGLLENIRNHPHCKWITYLLRSYFKL